MHRVVFIALIVASIGASKASAEICLDPVQAIGEKSRDQNTAKSNAAQAGFRTKRRALCGLVESQKQAHQMLRADQQRPESSVADISVQGTRAALR
jgi:hypothetical protein